MSMSSDINSANQDESGTSVTRRTVVNCSASTADSASQHHSSAAQPRQQKSARKPINSESDTKWFVILSVAFLAGLWILLSDEELSSALDERWGCYELYWFHLTWAFCLGLLLSIHLLLYLAPRPVSQVDASPLSVIVAAITLGGPIVFSVWSGRIWMNRQQHRVMCDPSAHQGLWYGMYAVGGVLGVGFASLISMFLSILCRAIWQRVTGHGQSAAVGVDRSSSSVPDDPSNPLHLTSAHGTLDNGRWLTMEARRIRNGGRL